MANLKDLNRGYGPGHTFWYVHGGEVCRSRWNDAGWCTHTGIQMNQITERDIQTLTQEAYKAGADDARLRIRKELGL